MNPHALLSDTDRRVLEALADPALQAGLKLAPADAAAEAHVPIPFVPVLRSTTDRHTVYGPMIEPAPEPRTNGQIYAVGSRLPGRGHVQAVGIGLLGLVVIRYFVERASGVRSILQKTLGVELPDVPARGRTRALRLAAWKQLGLSACTTDLSGKLDEDTWPEICERGAALAPSDGELLARTIELLVDEGRPAEARPLVQRLAPTWRHTWGEVDYQDIFEAIRATGHGPDDDPFGLGFVAHQSDFQARFQHSLDATRRGDWTTGTRLLHDLAFEEGDLHAVLPMLARGFHKMGLDSAVALCQARQVTAKTAARWPFSMEEALR